MEARDPQIRVCACGWKRWGRQKGTGIPSLGFYSLLCFFRVLLSTLFSRVFTHHH